MDQTRPVFVFDVGPNGTTFCRRCQCSFLSGCEVQHTLQNPQRHAAGVTASMISDVDRAIDAFWSDSERRA